MTRAVAIDLINDDPTEEIYAAITSQPRRVFAVVRSVGWREFYTAHEQGIEPEIVFVLADYAEYKNERLIDYNGARYRVVRTYVNGQTIELTAERGKV